MDQKLRELLSLPGTVLRRIEVGSLGRRELREALEANAIRLNEYARVLFSSERFIPSSPAGSAAVIELAVEDLGFAEGATFNELRERAREFGLADCPLELASYFRLQYRDQEEFEERERHKAPRGSVTLISAPLSDDEDFPKGFYLRKIEEELWLRGFICPLDHVWTPRDRLAFLLPLE